VIPALPLVVLAMAELLRIPLAQAFSQKKRSLARMLALAALIPLCGITVENWTFGIERIVTLRLHDVEPMRVALRAAEASVSDLQAAAESRRQRLEVDRANAEKLKVENQRQLDRLAEQRAIEISGHSKALGTIADCKMSPDPTCYSQRSRSEDARHKEALEKLAAEEARITSAMASLDTATAHSTYDDAGMESAKREMNLAHTAYTEASSQNQIYRLAGVFYGVTPEKLSDAQIVKARGFFSFFSACVVALIGLAAALIHYWPDSPASTSPFSIALGKLLRSLRGYLPRPLPGSSSVQRWPVSGLPPPAIQSLTRPPLRRSRAHRSPRQALGWLSCYVGFGRMISWDSPQGSRGLSIETDFSPW
jgi:hypothetical protein